MKLSERLKKYRLENNLSQTDLGNKLFVTKQTISKWETEKGYPDKTMYLAISDLLEVSVDELMEKEYKIKKRTNITTKTYLKIKYILYAMIYFSILPMISSVKIW